MQGDVTDAASVTAAMAGCCKCVACFGAQRLTKLSDLWTDSTQDPAHPYQINYMGVANLVEAAKATHASEHYAFCRVERTSRTTHEGPPA